MKNKNTFFLLIFLLAGCSSSLGNSNCPRSILDSFSTMQIVGENILDTTALMWEDQRACYKNDVVCEDGKWLISTETSGNACSIAYSVKVNGKVELIPMFYVDLETQRIYKDEDPLNFNAAGFLFKYLDQGYLELPPTSK
jgi:hypothetical protein